jgi:hypothetical protein
VAPTLNTNDLQVLIQLILWSSIIVIATAAADLSELRQPSGRFNRHYDHFKKGEACHYFIPFNVKTPPLFYFCPLQSGSKRSERDV